MRGTPEKKKESEQCILLCKNCLLGQACNKPYIYLNFDLYSFLPYHCPWAKPSPFLFDSLSYKYIDLGLTELHKSHQSKWACAV